MSNHAPDTVRDGRVPRETGIPSRFDMPHEEKYPSIERPHPQGLVARQGLIDPHFPKARGIEGNLGHETTYPKARDVVSLEQESQRQTLLTQEQELQRQALLTRAHELMGSLPGGETGYPQELEARARELLGRASSPNDYGIRVLGGIPRTASQPVVTNPDGGKQSAPLGRFDLIPGEALVRIADVLAYGLAPVEGVREGYPPDNWKLISGYQHVNHALEHLAMHVMQRTDEDHLGHALTRLAFAVWAEVNRGDMHQV